MRNALLFGFVSLLAAAASAQDVRLSNGSAQKVCGEGFFAGQTPGGSLGGLEIVGLTDDQTLVCIPERKPAISATIGAVSGLLGDVRLVGIDFRPATGELYALGNDGGVYTIDVASGEAKFQTQIDKKLSGTSFGIDFNPTVDLLRIVSDTGQNLAANVVTGATTVYTNNDLSAVTATTLFDINTVTDRVVIQAPPGNGTLNPTGNLRVDAGTDAGFDIYSALRDGVTFEVKPFAALTVGGQAGLYTLDLLTGAASLRGAFGASHRVVDLAVPLQQD
jgi:hypothetical protein